MYEAFFGLKEKPFSIQPDPDFLFFSKRHEMAFTMMEYGIQNRAGFSVISGDIGCGKTTLIRHLLNRLGSDLTVGIVYNTHREIADLLEWIMLAFGLPYENTSPVARYATFQQFLIDEYARGKRVVLIVDEAQNLSPGALESLRMLSNINADKDQLLQVVLVGQPQLKALLRLPELEQFSQRVSVDYFIPPLGPDEVARYISHRLSVAGRDAPLFTDAAVACIAQATRGVPRNINILCDTALVYGYSMEAEVIDEAIINDVIRDRATYGVFGNPHAAP